MTKLMVTRSVPLYEHFGLRAVQHGLVPETPINYWCMVREPGGG